MSKILLVSSAGGHFSELKKLKISDKYEKIIVSEKIKEDETIDYYLKYGSRNELFKYFFIFFYNAFLSLKIILKEKPNIIISTGAHSSVSFFIIGKILRKKTVYIESFAKVNSPSLTYKISKYFIDYCIVQHEEMLSVYEDALYFGGLY